MAMGDLLIDPPVRCVQQENDRFAARQLLHRCAMGNTHLTYCRSSPRKQAL